MSPKDRSPRATGWREIASLGEQLASATSLSAQRDRIVGMTSRLIRGRVEVWLHESLFRLPSWDAERLFPAQPRSEAMRRALKRRKLQVEHSKPKSGVRKAVAAIPLQEQGMLVGVVQETRGNGRDCTDEELVQIASMEWV